MTSLLSIKQLNKTINDFQLGPIDLTIESGTITAFVGNNGSGKSTLLKLIMQLVKPNAGTIQLAGKNVTVMSDEWKKHIAYQPQTAEGYHHFTGDTLKELMSTWYPNWSDALFYDMVDRLDVPLKKRFGTLSQGVQQKLLLALTLPSQAELLLLDEPTTFMDIPSKKIFIDFLTNWMEVDGRAIIMTSHQVEDIKKLSDYLFVLKDGHVLGHFVQDDLTERYQRYWLQHVPVQQDIPGEVFREGNTMISSDPQATEQFLKQQDVNWLDRTTVELEDIMALLLSQTSR